MQWIIGNIAGVGDVVFKAVPKDMDEPTFKFQKMCVVLYNPQRGIGLSRWVGHLGNLCGVEGTMRSSALTFWHTISDNAFAGKCEEVWDKGPAAGSKLVLPSQADLKLVGDQRPRG